ncbi:hypothetical protein PFICI_04400 [Pestalotiopsis fici W106-1]|uniref:Spindle pole body component n=1 Tax=Pestalotiopsis fici (strain W106-1 / CGMCC3.15140) TaxID=1229662 RepID=W3X920_PESFW|nr:uncharacterized protein PFICI_04400 [Pestalotiopsis fici W106-1]ETS82524.1 hypothetical protein PFICI_04400 [Pestalotiopsis fici W106-1]
MVRPEAPDVFAIPDFWRNTRLLHGILQPGQSEFFGLDIKSEDRTSFLETEKKVASVNSDEFFKIPPALQLPSLGTQDQEHHDTQPSDPPRIVKRQEENLFDDDFIQNAQAPRSTAEYKTWDGFVMPEVPLLEPIFITEAGAATYDAALDTPSDPLALQNSGRNLVETHPYISALLALSMGRGSIFFTWNEKLGSFVQDLDQLRISGFSETVLEGLLTRCLQCGNISRLLHVFVQITYKTHPSAGRVALAKAVDTLLVVVQSKLGGRAKKVASLLQLQSLVSPVYAILAYFNTLVNRLNKARSDEQMLSILFAETQALEHGDELLGDIMREVLARVSEPWLDFAQMWMGVKAEHGNPISKEGPGKSFVRVEDVAYVDDFGVENEELDYVLDERHVPAFIPDDISRTMFETGKSLRLLRTHHAEHPLCRLGIFESTKPPTLDWHYSWNDIEDLQRRVNEYENSVLEAIRHHRSGRQPEMRAEPNTHTGYSLQLFGKEGDQLAQQLIASITKLNQPLPSVSATDKLSQLLHDRLFVDGNSNETSGLDLVPHWSLLPLLSFAPLVEAQARLVNREYMRLIFSSHKIRDHLTLQRKFQLLGDGLFCTRLSHALFDSDLESAERQTSVARGGGVMGLRLGSRDTWPPASSELRLALMGILTECYFPAAKQVSWGQNQPELPGDMSFGVRDLTDEEIEKCLNPGSLEALDFLRLSYKPPPLLALIITPVILMKYDKIFKLLLRILRMLYVASELCRDIHGRETKWHDVSNTALRFRAEAQHFVTGITSYFFDDGIGPSWNHFENWLDTTQSDLENDSLADDKAPVISPDNVRERHEQVLDSIMHTLFLRKRQQPVLKVLDDIFTTILVFSRLSRLEALGQSRAGYNGPSISELYKTFKNKVEVFMTVCRGLSERKGHNAKAAKGDVTKEDARPAAHEENTIDRLLLRLEMSGYYGRPSYEHM